MRTWLLLFILAFAGSAGAQNILLKDGRVIATKGVRRWGDTIMATVDAPAANTGAPGRTAELGYPITQIAKIDFPRPPQLKEAGDLLAQGKAADALSRLEPLLKYYETVGDAPGSFWGETALLKVQALASLGENGPAETLAESVARHAIDPETLLGANVQVAAGLARRGDYERALAIYDTALKQATRPQTLAAAAANKGQSLLVRKEWSAAILSFLEVPVLYPEQKLWMPRVLLGCGRAYAGLQDLERAKASFHELTGAFPLTAEAGEARNELEKIAKFEKVNHK